MKRYLLGALSVLVLVLFVAGCKTAKPAPVAAEPSSIDTESTGLSPNGDTVHKTIEFSLLFGSRQAVKSWKVEISGASGIQKTFQGAGGELPASLTWDGNTDAHSLAPEGSYIARLSTEYTEAFAPAFCESRSFVLSISPPKPTLTVAPPRFIPSAKGVEGPVAILLEARSPLARIDNWSLDILDPTGRLFRRYSDKWPARVISWDGTSAAGDVVAPDETYTAVATVRDQYGSQGSAKISIPVSDIPLSAFPNLIEPRSTGFSPEGEVRTMELSVSFGNIEALTSWKVLITQAKRGVQKTFTGDGKDLPSTLRWDGSSDSGELAPEGVYYAVLSVDYSRAYTSVFVKSKNFVLDITPPAGHIIADPPKLTPDGKGGIQPLTFTIVASSETARIRDWTMKVSAPDGLSVFAYDGKWPQSSVSWDGKIGGGITVDPTSAYGVSAVVSDEYGNTGELAGSLAGGELPRVKGRVAVTPGSRGFSPNGDELMDVMELSLSYGQPSAVKSWKLDMVHEAKGVEKTFRGDGSHLPSSVAWEGKTSEGGSAPEGRYTAALTLDYGTVFKPAETTSTPFVLDVTPPRATIVLTPPLFSPMEASDTLSIALDAHSPTAAIDSWSMDIYDPGGNLFRSFDGKWPQKGVKWDGKGTNGDMVESAEEYPVTASVRDEFGNIGEAKATIPVDVLVEKIATGYFIKSSRIFFKAYTADYQDVPEELARQNTVRLDNLADKLKKFPGYRIRIVGHAVMIHWDNPSLGAIEQRDILLPLSRQRAAAVKKALVDRGLSPAMIATDGVGAADQLVPDSDLADRWRNRRAALFLDKER